MRGMCGRRDGKVKLLFGGLIKPNGRLHVVESQLQPTESTHCRQLAFAICNMLLTGGFILQKRSLNAENKKKTKRGDFFLLFACLLKICVYICNMNDTPKNNRRFHLFIEQKWIDRLKREMNSYGFTTVSSFVRFIIIKFFDKNKKQ